ncbi:cell wall hydrolase [Mangrovibrevibacter kandeliae]|uniref:cell wall hydrolase n=1 Tax=Mangrovibrevibacter kandeliae TaxID=2968473 RepID=UPI002118E233|nr:cell wall hydrolase [Aurantimonas sp. CSK15Z-1]MCQ8783776.1 cell wall hydrolase [Aurantimonas sp. CSK15Z-1]
MAEARGRRVSMRRDGRKTRTGMKALAVLVGGLLLVPAFTTSAAYQDMTSLLNGDGAAARWQTFFIPSPAGAIEEAKVAFASERVSERLPSGVGLQVRDGEKFTVATSRPVVVSPDEARVTRADKGRRVIAVTPAAPPRAFTAGSILQRQSALRPSLGQGDEEIASGFTSHRGKVLPVELAMNFQSRIGAIVPTTSAPPSVLVAAASHTGAAGETTALGYAEETGPNGAASLFGKILKNDPSTPFVPPVGDEDHAWAATPLPATAYADKEQACLARGIYFEARGESELGQAAVAQVILNRVRNPAYPKTICGVVYQNKNWRNRCQFSFACDGRKDRIRDADAWKEAESVADQVTKGEIWIPEVGSATHYHATYVKPRWANAMEKVDKIGRHIFYRTFGGGW